MADLSRKYEHTPANDIATAYLNDLGANLNKKTGGSGYVPRRVELAAYFTILRDMNSSNTAIKQIKDYVLSSSRNSLVQSYFGWGSADEVSSKVKAYANGILSEEVGRRAESMAHPPSPGRTSHDTSSSSSRSRSATPPPRLEDHGSPGFSSTDPQVARQSMGRQVEKKRGNNRGLERLEESGVPGSPQQTLESLPLLDDDGSRSGTPMPRANTGPFDGAATASAASSVDPKKKATGSSASKSDKTGGKKDPAPKPAAKKARK